MESLSEIVNDCRNEQGSREGRYHSWQTYYNSLERGFEYWESIESSGDDKLFREAHTELMSWAAVTWAQLQSLKARDMDEVTRVTEASDMV